MIGKGDRYFEFRRPLNSEVKQSDKFKIVKQINSVSLWSLWSLTLKMKLQVQSLKVLASCQVVKHRLDYSTYLNGAAKDKLVGLDTVQWTGWGGRVQDSTLQNNHGRTLRGQNTDIRRLG